MFAKARCRRVAARLALCGPSGSGKTYSALLVAAGLGGRVALIDTERGSSELYAELCDFDVLRLDPPFTAQRYLWAVDEAGRRGYAVCIVDSLSPAWSGEGGILARVDAAKAAAPPPGGSKRDPWAEPMRSHWKLVRALQESPCHVIVTLRVRTVWRAAAETGQGRGLEFGRRVGLAPEQKPGVEYEFTTALSLSPGDHRATVIKDRTGLFAGGAEQMTPDFGRRLQRWAEAGSCGAGDALLRALEAVAACGSLSELTRLWARKSGEWKGAMWFNEISEAVWARMKGLDERFSATAWADFRPAF